MNIVSFSGFSIRQDENGCQWIVRNSDNAAFASQTALAWMCEVDEKPIYNTLKQSKDCPKCLLGIELSGTLKTENPNGGSYIITVPADVCYKILYYHANEARGHEKRVMSKDLCKCMGSGGASLFIYGMAGYNLAPSDISRVSNEPNVVEVTSLELLAQTALQITTFHKEQIQLIQTTVQLVKETRVDVQTSAAFVTQEVKHEVRKGNDAVQLSLFTVQQEVEQIKEQLLIVQQQTNRKTKPRDCYNITVSLTPDEYATFIALAERAGYSRSGFCYKHLAHLFSKEVA